MKTSTIQLGEHWSQRHHRVIGGTHCQALANHRICGLRKGHNHQFVGRCRGGGGAGGGGGQFSTFQGVLCLLHWDAATARGQKG